MRSKGRSSVKATADNSRTEKMQRDTENSDKTSRNNQQHPSANATGLRLTVGWSLMACLAFSAVTWALIILFLIW